MTSFHSPHHQIRNLKNKELIQHCLFNQEFLITLLIVLQKNVAKEENRGWKIIQNDSARKYGPRDISQSWNFVNQKCVRFSLGQIIVFLTNTTLIIV